MSSSVIEFYIPSLNDPSKVVDHLHNRDDTKLTNFAHPRPRHNFTICTTMALNGREKNSRGHRTEGASRDPPPRDNIRL